MWHIYDGGSQMKSDRFLIKVAELYYRDGLSQQEIAKNYIHQEPVFPEH